MKTAPGHHIVVFAKSPLPGFVKTRLIPELGAELAAGLAKQMLEHALDQAARSAPAILELCVSPAPEDGKWRELQIPEGIRWSAQVSGDLGARLASAAQGAIGAGHPVLLMGGDCPSLSTELIGAAADCLNSCDAVLIPAYDGGYVLLGLKRFHPSLFEAMPWSGPRVAAETRARLHQLGWSLRELPALPDIDEPDDLQYLPADWASILEQIER